MSKGITRLVFSLFAGAVIFLVESCGIPFDITTQKQTIELPNTGGMYVEKAMDIPEQARQSSVSFSEVTLYYTVRRSGSFGAQVTLYASTDQTADTIQK